ncbi:unnamed protein product, partial [Darwinula stevensoni]
VCHHRRSSYDRIAITHYRAWFEDKEVKSGLPVTTQDVRLLISAVLKGVDKDLVALDAKQNLNDTEKTDIKGYMDMLKKTLSAFSNGTLDVISEFIRMKQQAMMKGANMQVGFGQREDLHAGNMSAQMKDAMCRQVASSHLLKFVSAVGLDVSDMVGDTGSDLMPTAWKIDGDMVYAGSKNIITGGFYWNPTAKCFCGGGDEGGRGGKRGRKKRRGNPFQGMPWGNGGSSGNSIDDNSNANRPKLPPGFNPMLSLMRDPEFMGEHFERMAQMLQNVDPSQLQAAIQSALGSMPSQLKDFLKSSLGESRQAYGGMSQDMANWFQQNDAQITQLLRAHGMQLATWIEQGNGTLGQHQQDIDGWFNQLGLNTGSLNRTAITWFLAHAAEAGVDPGSDFTQTNEQALRQWLTDQGWGDQERAINSLGQFSRSDFGHSNSNVMKATDIMRQLGDVLRVQGQGNVQQMLSNFPQFFGSLPGVGGRKKRSLD